MNGRQRFVIVLGFVVILLMGLFPPWTANLVNPTFSTPMKPEYGKWAVVDWDAGYHWLFSTPPEVKRLKSKGTMVQVVQVKIQDKANQELIKRLDAIYTPTFVLFDAGGQEIWRSVGQIDADEVKQALEGA